MLEYWSNAKKMQYSIAPSLQILLFTLYPADDPEQRCDKDPAQL